jgi:mono/diheme cytochrome c family protein
MNKKIFGGFLAAVSLALFQACSPASGDNPGHEYMPDMAHSVAYEANKIDEYSLHTWNKESVKTVTELWGTARMPVKGTIARGYVGLEAHNNSAEYATMLQKGVYTPFNGNVPYYYGDNDAERIRATKEIVMNPFPITKNALEKGKNLFKIYCGICHGEKGGGNGYLVRDDGKYPAQPANLLLDTFANGNNGRLYHAIMYGKNVMGNYADKLSYEERWDVIHYIRACQAAEKGAQYDEKWNTFKPTAGISDSLYQLTMASKVAKTVILKAPIKGVGAVGTEEAPVPHHTEGGH